jgi:hypothetical protein
MQQVASRSSRAALVGICVLAAGVMYLLGRDHRKRRAVSARRRDRTAGARVLASVAAFCVMGYGISRAHRALVWAREPARHAPIESNAPALVRTPPEETRDLARFENEGGAVPDNT